MGGLLLCLFIGPALSSSRALLLQMANQGKEGVAFGLYTMTGRAVAFVAPWLFSVFVDVFGAVRAGLGGISIGAARRPAGDAGGPCPTAPRGCPGGTDLNATTAGRRRS